MRGRAENSKIPTQTSITPRMISRLTGNLRVEKAIMPITA